LDWTSPTIGPFPSPDEESSAGRSSPARTKTYAVFTLTTDTRLSSFLPSLWSAIRIIAHERRGAIILIALQRHGAIILIALQRHRAIILIALQRHGAIITPEAQCNNPYCTPETKRNLNLKNLIVE
jgi:hypothetical protein